MACYGVVLGFNSTKGKLGRNFSIIVSFRNEEDRIHDLLVSLEKSDLNKVNLDEVIFINDHSTDNSVKRIEKWSKNQNFNVKIKHLSGVLGKKKALHLGIENSNSEYILTLDADVQFDSKFLYEVSRNFDGKTNLLIVPVIEKNGFFLSRIASHALSVLSVGLARIGIPINLNGAASAFKREDYIRLDPLANNYQISSGDDIFILKAFIKCRQCVIKPIINKGTNALTLGPTTILEFVYRGLRWSGKMKFVKLPFVNMIGMIILMTNFYVYYFFFCFFLMEFSMELIIWLGVKLLFDIIILHFSFFFHNQKRITAYTVPMYLIYPLYLGTVFILNLFQLKINWKGRPVLNIRSI